MLFICALVNCQLNRLFSFSVISNCLLLLLEAFMQEKLGHVF